MEHLNARDMPCGFLRNTFKIQTREQSLELANAFSPVAHALLLCASQENKLRIAFTGKRNTGKTTFAAKIAQKIFPKSPKTTLLHDWSTLYGEEGENTLLHFDADAIKNRLSAIPDDNLPMRMRRQWQKHKDTYANARMHFVEWPEHDSQNTHYNAIWDIIAPDPTIPQAREYTFYCTDEISQLPDYKTFLQNVSALVAT